MSKAVKGVTLTEEERALVYPAAPTRTEDNGAAGSAINAHTFSVSLPDGQPCPVVYTRYGLRSHRIEFQMPLQQSFWINTRLSGIAAIEAKGQELLTEALQKAREQEQKAMRQKSAPAGRPRGTRDSGPELDQKSAERFAGKYAVCMRFQSGRLMRIGPVHEKAEAAAAEIRAGKHRSWRLFPGQQIVIGLCNRSAQQWQEPQFLSDPIRIEAPSPSAPLTAVTAPEPPSSRRATRSRNARAQKAKAREE